MVDVMLPSMLSDGTSAPAARLREKQLLIIESGSETPLPERLSMSALGQLPTQGVSPARSILAELGKIERHRRAPGGLGISAADQELVSRVVAANMPSGTTKRLLGRRAR